MRNLPHGGENRMATASVRITRGSSLGMRTERTPHTFQGALREGWAVVSDKSAQSTNQKRREGTLTMRKPGFASVLTVDYIGSLKGYQFSVPKFAE
jgi:hypothetical protein